MSSNFYKEGDHNVICDICGKKRKRSDCQMTWEQYMACRDTCFDSRHPDTLPIPVRQDGMSVANVRSRPTFEYVVVGAPGYFTWTGNIAFTSIEYPLGFNGQPTWDQADINWGDT